jgi:hypothetical protein
VVVIADQEGRGVTRAAIFGNVGHDTWLTDVLVGGLESMNKGFPNDGLEVVTDHKTVEIICGARHPNVEVISKGRPHVLFMINTSTRRDVKIVERALMLGVPVYQIFNGNPANLDVRTDA